MLECFVQLAREGYEAAARGDFAVLSDLLDPDVQWHGGDPTDPGSCHNRQEALEFMRQARGRGGIGELVEAVDAGDQVVVILRPPGAGGGPAGLVANLSTFRDGKVVAMVHYSDPDAALAAAGAL